MKSVSRQMYISSMSRPQVDWVIAQILGFTTTVVKLGPIGETPRVVVDSRGELFDMLLGVPFRPSSDWTQGGPLFSFAGIWAEPVWIQALLQGWRSRPAQNPSSDPSLSFAHPCWVADTELFARACGFVGAAKGDPFTADYPEVLCR